MNLMLPDINISFRVEKWRWNKEYRIYVSNLGHFKDEHKRLLPIRVKSDGYLFIKTACGIKSAHRLVLLTWKPIPDAENLTVDHIDHNKRNNSVANLEWVTAEENVERAKRDLIVEEKPAEKSTTIKAGKLSFADIEEAIDWVLEETGNYNCIAANRYNIQKRIENAINNDKMYVGRKWRNI